MNKIIKTVDFLKVATFFYIVCPICVFLGTWVSPFYSIVAFVFIALFLFFNRIEFKKRTLYFTINRRQVVVLLLTLILIFFWVFYSGIGGYVGQNFDYIKHNELIHDLFYSAWPVRYDGSGTLIYYIAFYIVPVGLGKIFGYQFINIFMFIMLYVGIVIAYFWLSRYLKRFSIIPMIILIFWGGFEYLAYFLLHHNLFPIGGLYLNSWTKFEGFRYLGGLSYQAITTDFYFAPQISITGLIIPLYLMNEIKEKNISQIPYLIVSCLPLWCPFIFVGILPFLIYYFYACVKQSKNFLKSLHVLTIICCFYIFALLFIYITSNSQATSKFAVLTSFITSYQNVLVLILFYFVEFGFVFIYLLIFKNPSYDFNPAWIALFALLLTPIIYIGEYDDFAMRVSIPSLIVLFLYFTEIILYSVHNLKNKKNILALILASIIFLNMIPTGFNDIIRPVVSGRIDNSDLYTQTLADDSFSYQYISADNDNLYEKLIAN